MTESDFKQLFHAPYTRDAWKKVLNSIFSSSEFFIKDVPIEPKKNAKQIHQFGKITLSDGKSLGLFEVEVTPDTQIARNRVALRENASALIDFDRFHGALAIFYQPGQADYRFSFIAKQTELMDGTLKIEQTHPKRFTYVLGINEPCTTPAKRFLKLLEKRDIKLEDVIEAFEVETLTKEFFKKYKDHYETFCEHLIESKYRKSVFKIPEIKDDDERKKAEKPIRDFVKKLLGRIVFLYFLQKKGWLGVPKDRRDWAGGDPEFMKNLFTRFDSKKHFYSQCLVRLFFETLNTNRPNDLFEITGSRIPYLNGGLFDDDLPESNVIDLPAELFEKLFEFFGEYNFTIDENSPDDHEVGIDPEMLGHIFENLLEDNKDKGAYYTPKAIVHYMCQESLIQYLKTHLASTGFEMAIERFIRIGDKGDEKDKDNLIRQNAAQIEELLDTVKICDPAIGSGAFPMGLLQEILKAKSTLDWTLDRAKTKRNIIQNSIYGVDIDKGAVDIARLRFWLALVVDEEAPEPLPNLDYKIMQGNSLLESFEGIDLSKIMNVQKVSVVDSQMNLLTGKEKNPQTKIDFNTTRRDDLKKLLDSYFTENDKVQKEELHRKIDRIVLDHIHANLEFHKNKLTIEMNGLMKTVDERTQSLKTSSQKEKYRKDSKEAKVLARKKSELAHVDEKFNKLQRLEETSERPYFLWHLYFREIFDRGGFDIVIGNPPYGMELTDLEKERFETKYPSFITSTKNSAIFFTYLANDIQNTTSGINTFIVPKSLCYSQGWNKCAVFISSRLKKMIDVGKAFENVKLEQVIFLLSKNGVYSNFTNGRFEDEGIRELVSVDLELFNKFKVLLAGQSMSEINVILKAVKKHRNTWGEFVAIERGLNWQNLSKTHKGKTPIHRGAQLNKYFLESATDFISLQKFSKNEYDYQFNPKILNQLAIAHVQNPYPHFYLQSALDTDNKLVFETISCTFPTTPKLDLRFLLAINNSKLFAWLLYKFIYSNAIRSTRYDEFYVGKIPCPDLLETDQKVFVRNVDLILSNKKKNSSADTSQLEKEIDVLVYKLYDLTYEEVRVVDPDFEMTKEKYEQFEIK